MTSCDLDGGFRLYTDMRTLLSILLVSFFLLSCDDRPGDFRNAPAPATPPAAATPPPQPQVRVVPLDSVGFAEQIKTIYAKQKTSIPRKLMDSAMRLGHPDKINRVLERYMEERDSVIRAQMAEKYLIPIDSLNRILGKRKSSS